MFDREMMIQGLRKQHKLLSELIVELEQKPVFDLDSFCLTHTRTKLVSHNLRKLRRIKDNYLQFQQTQKNYSNASTS